tara:strand:+ start:275 stop:451 length:177 start_codon:yes stop_codon:yes gene_type:complete
MNPTTQSPDSPNTLNIFDSDTRYSDHEITKKLLEKYKPKRNHVKAIPIERIPNVEEAA